MGGTAGPPVDRRLVLALAVLVAAAVLAVAAWPSVVALAGVSESGYGYSVTVATNASLQDVELRLPLQARPDGTGPVVATFRAGEASVPTGWQADVVAGDSGPDLRLRADTIPAERRSDGRRYSTFQVSASAPAVRAIDTGAPYGTEPTVAPVDGCREVPCPNLVGPGDGSTCYRFDAQVYATYDAPEDATVDVHLVATGANEFTLGGRAQYYERLLLRLDGPGGGWITGEGFASTQDRP